MSPRSTASSASRARRAPRGEVAPSAAQVGSSHLAPDLCAGSVILELSSATP
jgi:hypothetical protein